MRKAAIALALFVAGCASVRADDTPDPSKVRPSTETWFVVFPKGKTDANLAARPARTHLQRTLVAPPPGAFPFPTIKVEKLELPAMPALKLKAVQAAMLKRLNHLYRRHRIEFCVSEREFGGLNNAVILRKHATKPGMVFGMAGRIDAMNRRQDDRVEAYLSTLIEEMREDPARAAAKGALRVTEKDVGAALGTRVAHEIGHALGCRHNALEATPDKATLMVQGLAKYRLQFLWSVRIHYQTAVYLDRVLGVKPGAEPIKAPFGLQVAMP
jgi:hypothetical protein